ncbi:acetyltransferase [Roseococcus sp. SDR]|uniref:acetyltransferase n=1 Tax=Roseococcus sp. SDR TaxID=2835532 RepID=UPI001BCEAE49|nr:acetyltransferase [Roseococcus sp. SDR]MBS7789681.1 acetyltransferase [Roseococcus sp. SDR]MBV1844995.1 acetyltransferase [Roseococcus sp. SDR]
MSAPEKLHDLVLVGDSAFAEVAHEYFTAFSPFRVVAFAVERAFLKRESLCGLPVVPLEELPARYPPAAHHAHVAVVYTQLNRLRARLVRQVAAAGYPLASFVSPHAFIAPSARLGRHCFIFENNVVQSFTEIGENVVLWSGNHIGHHSRVGDNVFVSSHVVVSGFCEIGANSFLGVNVAIGNNLKVAADNWIGQGVVISRDTEEGQMFRPPEQEAAKVGAKRFFRVRDEPPA